MVTQERLGTDLGTVTTGYVRWPAVPEDGEKTHAMLLCNARDNGPQTGLPGRRIPFGCGGHDRCISENAGRIEAHISMIRPRKNIGTQ